MSSTAHESFREGMTELSERYKVLLAKQEAVRAEILELTKISPDQGEENIYAVCVDAFDSMTLAQRAQLLEKMALYLAMTEQIQKLLHDGQMF